VSSEIVPSRPRHAIPATPVIPAAAAPAVTRPTAAPPPTRWQASSAMPSKPIPAAELRAALRAVAGWLDAPSGSVAAPDRPALAAAVRTSLRSFAQAYPGKAVEVRVPPFAAVQCLEGGAHTRGTPPHVVETDPRTWLLLVTGRLSWRAALDAARVQASGHRSDDVGERLPFATESDELNARFE
jgi:hypothetical protein